MVLPAMRGNYFFKKIDFELLEKSKEAMNKPSQALEMNSKAIEENGKAVTEMVNLLRARLISLCSQLSDG